MAGGEALEFLLKLDAQIDGALKMVRVLTQTEKGLNQAEAAILKTEKSTVKAGVGHGKHAKDAEKLNGVLHRLVHSGMEPFLQRAKSIAEFEFLRRAVDKIIDAPMEMIHMFAELGKEILHVAAATQALEKSFTFALGKERGEETLEWADKLAKVTNYTDDEIKGMALSFSKVGLEGQKMEDSIRAALDIAALSPDRIGGLQDAVGSLSKMARTGVIDNRALAGLGIGAKDFAQLDRFKGQSKKQIAKMMEEGSITSDEVFKLITIKTGKALGGAGVEMGKNLEASLLHVKSLPEQYLQKFSKSPALEIVRGKLEDLLNALDPDSPRGMRIFGALEKAVLGVVDTLATFDWERGVQGMLDVLKLIPPILEAIGDTLSGFATLVNGIVHPLESLKAVWSGVTENLEGKTDESKAGRIIHALTPIGFVSDMINRFRSAPQIAEATQGVGKLAGAGIATGMMSKSIAVETATRDVGMSSVNALRSELQIHSPSRVFQGLGAQAAAGFVIGMDTGRPNVSRASTDLVSIPDVPAGGRGGTMSVNVGGITIQIQSDGHGTSRAQADEIAARISEILPSRLAAALEKIAIEMGAGGVS